MFTNQEILIFHYHYDPLDRLAVCTTSETANSQRFYLRNRLVTEILGTAQYTIFRQEDRLLAQRKHQSVSVETNLLITDQQDSVIIGLDAAQSHSLAYTPYGYRNSRGSLLSLLGFNGERPEQMTGHYLLGNGYRAFNPILMRFNSPDSWSPFGAGWLNVYAYCQGEPVNHNDPTGHILGGRVLTRPMPPPKFHRPIVSHKTDLSRLSEIGNAPGQRFDALISVARVDRHINVRPNITAWVEEFVNTHSASSRYGANYEPFSVTRATLPQNFINTSISLRDIRDIRNIRSPSIRTPQQNPALDSLPSYSQLFDNPQSPDYLPSFDEAIGKVPPSYAPPSNEDVRRLRNS